MRSVDGRWSREAQPGPSRGQHIAQHTNVVRRAARRLDHDVPLVDLGEAEVRDADVGVVVGAGVQQVLRLWREAWQAGALEFRCQLGCLGEVKKKNREWGTAGVLKELCSFLF